jgi:hypothetical protein
MYEAVKAICGRLMVGHLDPDASNARIVHCGMTRGNQLRPSTCTHNQLRLLKMHAYKVYLIGIYLIGVHFMGVYCTLQTYNHLQKVIGRFREHVTAPHTPRILPGNYSINIHPSYA